MSKNLNYSDIDTDIQTRMASAVPSETVRLRAINGALNELYSQFDLDSSIRNFVGYMVANGRAIDITDFVSDFKHAKDLRFQSAKKHDEELAFIDDDEFAVHIGNGQRINEYTIAENDGKTFIKLNTQDGPKPSILHPMNSLTDSGTWAMDIVNGDGTNLAVTSVRNLEQTASLMFDADVSQSGNNYILLENPDMDAKDLSEYDTLGRVQMNIYIPSVTNFTSVEARWGSSDANYFSAAVTTQADGSDFQVGWNRVSIDWADATETGTVVNTAVDYLAVKINYAAGYTDQTNFVVEEIVMYLPEPMEFLYYTFFLSQDASGTFQEQLTATAAETLVIPRRYLKLIVFGAMRYLIPVAFGDDGIIRLRKVEKEYFQEVSHLDLDGGNRVKVPVKKIKLRKQW